MERAELASDMHRRRVDSSQSNGSATEEAAANLDRQLNPWAPDEGRHVTLEEYWVKWYENSYPDMDVSYEWKNSRLDARPLPNLQQLELYNWFLDLLRCYLSTHDIANLINLETGFVLTMEDAEEEAHRQAVIRVQEFQAELARLRQRSF